MKRVAVLSFHYRNLYVSIAETYLQKEKVEEETNPSDGDDMLSKICLAYVRSDQIIVIFFQTIE
jgi:hypothetical protein